MRIAGMAKSVAWNYFRNNCGLGCMGGQKGAAGKFLSEALTPRNTRQLRPSRRICRTGGWGEKAAWGDGIHAAASGGVNAIRKRLPRKLRRAGRRRRGRIGYCRSPGLWRAIGAATRECELPTPASASAKAISRPSSSTS